ncbi:Rv1733c family protein [Nocardia sp. R7R-8]|uniref:Rv1733c family protein n=1 Tax=Nocardia sp. R7R-8 TaxID=3459304 RepID=UPI00403D9858
MSRYPSPAVRLWRRRPWNDNPLMRASDRWQALLGLLVGMVVVIAIPLAGAAGTAGYTQAGERIRVENSAKVAVPATVVGTPGPVAPTARYDGAEERFQAPVRWSHDGREGSATVEVPGAAEPGSRITVWFDPTGTVTTPPRPSSDAAWAGIVYGSVALLGMWCGAMAVLLSTGWLLGRIRSARLDAEWRRLSRPIGTDME